MRSGLTNPSPLKSNYVNFSGKLFNVILVKEERPPLQKSAAWLIEPTDRARSPSSIPIFGRCAPSNQRQFSTIQRRRFDRYDPPQRRGRMASYGARVGYHQRGPIRGAESGGVPFSEEALLSCSAFATRRRHHEEAMACYRREPCALHKRYGTALPQGPTASAPGV
jgi:hypothetical protein